jgi:hypothetical protein
MWVTVTFAYMILALVLTAQLVSDERRCDASGRALLPRLQVSDGGSADARAAIRDDSLGNRVTQCR